MDLTLSNITINQILIFLTVAETEGFLKASAELNLTQSAVSKSIAKLEKDLNLQLFLRSTRQLHLTREGKQLYEAWKPMIISIQTAYKHVARNHDEDMRTLRIGLVNTVIPEKYFSPLHDTLQKDCPDIRLQIYIESMFILGEMLSEGKLDIVFLPDFEHYTLEEQGISWMWYRKMHARLILSSKHPLASKKTLCMDDILNEKFVSLQSQDQENYERDLKERFSDYDAVPNIVMPYHSPYALRNLFRPKDELLFIDQFFDNINYEDIRKIPIEDQWNGIICGWKETGNSTLQRALEIIRQNSIFEE